MLTDEITGTRNTPIQFKTALFHLDLGTISLTFMTRRKMGILRHVVNRFHKTYDMLYGMLIEPIKPLHLQKCLQLTTL